MAMARTTKPTGNLAEEVLKEVRARIRAAEISLDEAYRRLLSGLRADAFDLWLRAYTYVSVGSVLLDLLASVRAVSPKEHRELCAALGELHRDVWRLYEAIGLPV